MEHPKTTSLTERPAAASETLRRTLARLDLLYRGPVSLTECAVFAILTLGLALAIFGPHISGGGFVLDDWAFAADSRRYGGVLDFASGLVGSDVIIQDRGRPLNTLYYATTHTVFGTSTELHLALAVLLAVAMSVMLYVLFRTLGLERLHSGAIAALVLVFPAADSARLWPTAASYQLAIAFFIGGLLLALRGLGSSGRGALLLHTGALAAYAASLLTYEITAGVLVLTGLVYRLRAPWRRVVPRWGADLLLAGAGVLYVREVRAGGVLGIGEQVDNIRMFQSDARALLSHLGIEDAEPLVSLKVIALLVLVAVLLSVFLSHGDVLRRDLRRWLKVSLAGAVAIGAGYLALIPAGGRSPLGQGFANRVNIAASVGFTILTYAIIALVAVMVVRAFAALRPLRSARTWATVLGAAGAASLGVVWVQEVRDDRDAWDRAERVRDRTVAVLRTSPRPPRGSTVYAFGVRDEVAPGVVTFAAPFDLVGAVRLLWDDRTLFAHPSGSLERGGDWGNFGDHWGLECTRSSVVPRARYAMGGPSPYGKAVFVDVPARRSTVVRSREQCRAWASRHGLLRV